MIKTLLLLTVALVAAAEPGQLRIGEKAPAFELETLKGKKLSSETLKGQPALIFFAATWCPFSNRKAKSVQELSQAYKGKLNVILVDVKEKDKKLIEKKWVGKKKMTCPILLDLDGSVTRAYGPPPAFNPGVAREDMMSSIVILLDSTGVIRHYSQPTENTQEVDWDLKGIRTTLDQLLAKK